MKPTYLTILAALAAFALPVSQASAGMKTAAAVVINTTTRTASGGFGAARANSDTAQYIGCWSTQNMATKVMSGGCQAKKGSTAVSCTFPAGASMFYVIGLQTLNTDSQINFTWDSSGVCTSLVVNNYSYYQPKVR